MIGIMVDSHEPEHNQSTHCEKCGRELNKCKCDTTLVKIQEFSKYAGRVLMLFSVFIVIPMVTWVLIIWAIYNLMTGDN